MIHRHQALFSLRGGLCFTALMGLICCVLHIKPLYPLMAPGGACPLGWLLGLGFVAISSSPLPPRSVFSCNLWKLFTSILFSRDKNANLLALHMVRERRRGRKEDLCDLFIHYSTVHGKSSLYMIDLPGFDYNTQLTFSKSACVIQEKGWRLLPWHWGISWERGRGEKRERGRERGNDASLLPSQV